MRFKDFAALFVLLITAYFSLATSKLRDAVAPLNGNIYILSDCTVPASEAVVTVSGGTIIAPGGVSFTDFGFPSATIGQSMVGPVGFVIRECTVTYGENGTNGVDNRWLYTCFEGGRYRCSIYTQPQ